MTDDQATYCYDVTAESDQSGYLDRLSWRPLVEEEPEAQFTERGLVLRPGLTFTRWLHHTRTAMALHRVSGWCVGDALAYGEDNYGEAFAQAIDPEDRTIPAQTLLNCASVSRRVPAERRRPELSWSHHAEVASLEPAEQSRVLAEAARDGLSSRAVRERVRELRAEPTGAGSQVEPETVEQLVCRDCGSLDVERRVVAAAPSPAQGRGG